MNFEPLFLTTRVVTAVYRTASTVILIYYLTRRLQDGRETFGDGGRRYRRYR